MRPSPPPFDGEILVHPRYTPNRLGIGMKMRSGPMLWVLSGCCLTTLQRVGNGDGIWSLEWFCHECQKVVRSGGEGLPVGLPVVRGDSINTYMEARKWVGDWVGLSRYDVEVRVRW